MMRNVYVVLILISFFACSKKRKLSENLEMIRSPYLQNVWADSASVLWKTSKATNCSVKFGKHPDSLDQKIDGVIYFNDFGTFNEVTLRGLERGEKYYYAVYSNDTLLLASKELYFETEAQKDTADFSFYALGDIGEPKAEGGFPDVTANQILKLERKPDFGIGLGDIVYPDGESEGYDEHFFSHFMGLFLNTPFYPALGNHDWRSSTEDNFEAEWRLPNNEHYYEFFYQNAHFIALDSRNGDFYDKESQVAWLKNKLEKAKGKYDWTFVYLHHNGKTCTYKEDYPHVMSLYSVFANSQVDFVLNGHAHTYERLKPFDANGTVIANITDFENFSEIKNGFISITTGAGGKLKSPKKFTPSPETCDHGNITADVEHVGHFMTFDIKGKTLKAKAINSFTGEVFDTFSMEK